MKNKSFEYEDILFICLFVCMALMFCLFAYEEGLQDAQIENIVEDLKDSECYRIKEEYESLRKTIEVYGIEEVIE